MNVSINVDDSALQAKLRDLSAKGIAYGTVNALNNIAKLIQKSEVEQVEKDFTIRTSATKTFITRQAAIIKPFASVGQGRPFVEIAVGQKSRLLLPVFEAGGVRAPFYGTKGVVAVPVTGTSARPSFTQPVPKTMFMRSLAIKARKTKAGKIQFKGKDRTFLLKSTGKHPKGGIFQRVGTGRDDIRLIYSFKPNPKLKALLKFVKTAERVGNQWLQREFADQIQREVDRASRRAG